MTTRRQFLGVGAAVLATAWSRPVVPSGWIARRSLQTTDLTIVALAQLGGGYVGLVRGPDDGPAELRQLVADADGALWPGDRFGPPLPADLLPVAVAPSGDGARLLVGGGRPIVVEEVATLPVTAPDPAAPDEHGAIDPFRPVDDTLPQELVPVRGTRPALLWVDGAGAEELPVPVDASRSSFSLVEALTTAPGNRDGIRALVAGGDSEEAIYAAALDVLTVAPGEVTDGATIARDLGESGPNHLVTTADGTTEVVVNRTADPVVDGNELTHLRLSLDRAAVQVRSSTRPRPGRVTALLAQGAVVEEPETGTVAWDSPTGEPPPAVLAGLHPDPEGSPSLLVVPGDPERAAVRLGDSVVLADL